MIILFLWIFGLHYIGRTLKFRKWREVRDRRTLNACRIFWLSHYHYQVVCIVDCCIMCVSVLLRCIEGELRTMRLTLCILIIL